MTEQTKPKLSYNSYLKVPELISLQQLESEPGAHDELLFIIIHQAYELWFKQILFELDTVAECLDDNDVYEANRLLRRVAKIQLLLVDQIHILETMMPRDFLTFRKALNPASGFQSIQFRELEFAAGLKSEAVLDSMKRIGSDTTKLEQRFQTPSLREKFYALLQRRGFDVSVPKDGQNPLGDDLDKTLEALKIIYAEPEHNFKMYSLGECLVQMDQNLLMWRFHHVRVVERLIGAKMGTGGSAGVKYLESTLEKRAFPMLWYVRGMMEDDDYYGKERERAE